MNEKEAADLKSFQEDVIKVKLNFFIQARLFYPMKQEELSNCGFASASDAVKSYFVDAEKKIAKLEKEFLKKYPD